MFKAYPPEVSYWRYSPSLTVDRIFHGFNLGVCISRDDLAYDLDLHVDVSVHLFEEWALPIWKTDENSDRFDGSKDMASLKIDKNIVDEENWYCFIN